MLSFAYKRFDGHVPEPGNPSSPSAKGLDAADRALLAKVAGGFKTVGELYATSRFRAALNKALALAREANGYTFATLSAGLDRKAPWFQINGERAAAGSGAAQAGTTVQKAGREPDRQRVRAAGGVTDYRVPGRCPSTS